ncbi:MAG: hypothetical protein J6Y62_00130 [Clostridia bacterium]|nr:hypothetical protein [Clostridia bacterium]
MKFQKDVYWKEEDLKWMEEAGVLQEADQFARGKFRYRLPLTEAGNAFFSLTPKGKPAVNVRTKDSRFECGAQGLKAKTAFEKAVIKMTNVWKDLGHMAAEAYALQEKLRKGEK